MGAGGQFIIINETEYNWKVEKDGGYEAYQMNNWIPNQDVGAHTSIVHYIEYNDAAQVRSDTNGRIRFRMEGTGTIFEIQARNDPARIYLNTMSLSTPRHSKESRHKIEWWHDGAMVLAISGTEGNFTIGMARYGGEEKI